MIQKQLHPSHLSKWKFPIDVNCYDQQPELSEMERLALVQALRNVMRRWRTTPYENGVESKWQRSREKTTNSIL